tara:strand:+ start:736 stop:1068 length:333 start_codon:yes stop_codon:yes gene_type:complete
MSKTFNRGFEMNNEFINKYSLEYVDFIRNKQCCVSGSDIADPHHLHAIGMGSNRLKPNARHFTCIPLSREMHTELHAQGLPYFQQKYKIDLWQEAYYFFINFLIQKEVIK